MTMLQTLTAAAVVGALQVVLAMSYAALIFSGDLAPFVGAGLGFALFTAAASGFVVALLASVPGTVGSAKGIPAALLASLAAGVVAGVPAALPAEVRFVTVVVAVGLSSIACGCIVLALGYFRLGRLVRFLPYPVIGGFVTGTGWLLTEKALELVARAPLELASLGGWITPDVAPQWMLALAVAVALLVATEMVRHPLALPLLILAITVATVGWVAVSDATWSGLERAGWLLGPFPEGGLWRPSAIGPLAAVHWPTIGTQVAAMIVIALVVAMEVLLNATGLEVELATDVDLDRELRSAGLASIASGTGAGIIGYQALSLSLVGHRLGGGTRAGAFAASLVPLAALVVGAGFLALAPTFLLSGLMGFVGLQLIKSWVVDAWSYMPGLEYALLLIIAASIALAGILPGVAAGVVASVLLFVIAYGRVDVVRHELSAAHGASRVTRASAERDTLALHADAIRILQLQGYLFFGTADRLVRHMERSIRQRRQTAPTYLVLDFRRVTGVDATAAFGLRKLRSLASARDVHMVLVHLTPQVEARLRAVGLQGAAHVTTFADLDRGLEWCENALLREAKVAADPSHNGPLWALDVAPATREALARYFIRQELSQGEVLVSQGQASDTLWVVESGTLTAWLEQTSGPPLRLESVGAGRMLGELGFFLRNRRSATVVADAPSVVHALDRASFDTMVREDPRTALAFQEATTRLLSERVTHLVGVVRALEQ